MTPHQERTGPGAVPAQAAFLPAPEGTKKAVTDFLKTLMDQGGLDALLVPVEVPDTPFHAWVMVKKSEVLDKAHPLPPVMSVQGGRALSSLTKHGTPWLHIAAVMRPCEARAAVELAKLKQVRLDNVVLITIDCPGALPLAEYVADPEKGQERYKTVADTWHENEFLRPACARCHRFSLTGLEDGPSEGPAPDDAPASVDIHIGLLGEDQNGILLLPVTPSGAEILKKTGLEADRPTAGWENRVRDLLKKKKEKRQAAHEEFRKDITGLDRFLTVFDPCINCHNCMNVCPVCYCQQCYFDTQTQFCTSSVYMDRARKRGALRFPPDPLLFHLGRMSHMVLSCVSCGACEDACPVSIPVGKVFSWVADETQPAFGYSAGTDRGDPLPLQNFLKEEFCEIETPSACGQAQSTEVKENA